MQALCFLCLLGFGFGFTSRVAVGALLFIMTRGSYDIRANLSLPAYS